MIREEAALSKKPRVGPVEILVRDSEIGVRKRSGGLVEVPPCVRDAVIDVTELCENSVSPITILRSQLGDVSQMAFEQRGSKIRQGQGITKRQLSVKLRQSTCTPALRGQKSVDRGDGAGEIMGIASVRTQVLSHPPQRFRPKVRRESLTKVIGCEDYTDTELR